MKAGKEPVCKFKTAVILTAIKIDEMKKFKDLTKVYPLSKTLAFKLVPVGNTDNNIHSGGILKADKELEDDFMRLKEIADGFHKDFIEDILGDVRLVLRDKGKLDSLEEYARLFDSDRKSDENLQAQFAQVQTALRQQIGKAFTADSRFAKLDKKEFVTELLAGRVTGADKSLVARFNGFTSYLGGYNTSRLGFYEDNDKVSTIPNRIIMENLPVFYTNICIYENMREVLGKELMDQIYSEFEAYLNVKDMDEFFSLPNFNHVLTQAQIEVYNGILNGFNTEKGRVEGINYYARRWNMQRAEGEKEMPMLKKMKKQLLSDRVKLSWTDTEFTTAKDMMAAIRDFHSFFKDEIEIELRGLLLNLTQYNLEGIYLRNDKGLTQVSQSHYGRWAAVSEELQQVYSDKVPPRKRKESESDFLGRVSKHINKMDSFTIAELDRYMFAHGKPLAEYFAKMGAHDTGVNQKVNVFVAVGNAWTDLSPLVEHVLGDNLKQITKATDTMKVKNYMDSLIELLHFIKPLCGKGDENGRDAVFYEKFDEAYESLSSVVSLYNRARNFLTKKPFSTKKLKLNFGSPTLLKGWSRDKERANRSCILRKDGMYYLAIMDKTGLGVFTDAPAGEPGSSYEKMYYDLFGDAAKMLPKIAFAEKNADLYNPTEEILRIRREGSYKAGPTFNLNDLHAMIDFYKKCMSQNPKWGHIKFPWKETAEYQNFKQFVDDFVGYDYVVEFQPISEDYIHQMIDEGKIYLFQICNKDLSPNSKGKKSLYTQYFSMLFDPQNLQNVIYKLSGGAEMFYRKASLHPVRPTHPAGIPVENKRPSADGKPRTRVFAYDLIKDRRYTKDQYMLHLPIAVNYSVVDTKGMPVTARVRELIREGAFRHIMGIHRGEKNLLYVSVIDLNGKIVEQQSLNIIESECNGRKIYTDYNELLQRRSDERMQARKDWQTIENIKYIKEGYISQVVSIITDMILKYEALVVMESLDDKFIDSRMKIEKNIYRKFNKQLVDKLNYLVKKDREKEEAGGLLNAYQLADRVEGSVYQNGIIFYVPAAYTSAVCPVTGFVNLFRLRYDTMEGVCAFFSKFDSIRYNPGQDRFEFTFDYANFTDKAQGSRTRWTVATHGQRIYNYKNNGVWHSEEVSLTAMFRRLFVTHGIDISGNLKEAIATVGKRSFYEELVTLFGLMMQMVNTSGKFDADYIVSPVVQDDGSWFLSSPRKREWPVDSDANAAFNIARKGLMLVSNIQSVSEGGKVRMGITNVDWFRFIQ